MERNRISSLQSHGKALEKECCLSGIFRDSVILWLPATVLCSVVISPANYYYHGMRYYYYYCYYFYYFLAHQHKACRQLKIKSLLLYRPVEHRDDSSLRRCHMSPDVELPTHLQQSQVSSCVHRRQWAYTCDDLLRASASRAMHCVSVQERATHADQWRSNGVGDCRVDKLQGARVHFTSLYLPSSST